MSRNPSSEKVASGNISSTPPLNAEFVRLLAASGWTQAQAARELHLDPGTVSRYVSGEVTPSMTVLRLFHLATGDRLPIPGTAQGWTLRETDAPDPAGVSDAERTVLDALRLWPAEQRARVAKAIRELLSALHQ